MSQAITITTQDGCTLAATLFEATQPRAVVVIAGALGVRRRYYASYARFLAASGLTVLSFDYRGSGNSAVDNASGLSLADWGRQDIDAAICHSQGHGLPVYLVGHSIGGQVLGLARRASALSGVILVASTAPYWRRWRFPQILPVFAITRLLIPLAAAMTRQFPVKLFGLGNQPLPSSLIRTWGRWMAKPDYLFDSSFGLDVARYREVRSPMHFIGLTDDGLAPKANIEILMAYYPNADTSLEMISPASVGASGIGHTGFFHERFSTTLWPATLARLGEAGA